VGAAVDVFHPTCYFCNFLDFHEGRKHGDKNLKEIIKRDKILCWVGPSTYYVDSSLWSKKQKGKDCDFSIVQREHH